MLVVQPNGISGYGSGGEAASAKPVAAASGSASPQKDVSGASPAEKRPNSAETQDPTFDSEKALLQKAAEETQKYLQSNEKKTRLSIVYDEDADSFIYQSLDRSTGEVVDQYPAEDVIKRIAAYREGTGLVVDATL